MRRVSVYKTGWKKTVVIDTLEVLLFISEYSTNYGMYYILLESLERHVSNGTLLKALA